MSVAAPAECRCPEVDLGRRRVIIGSAAMALVTGIPPVRAKSAGATKAGAWLLGDNLSLAGLVYAQGKSEDTAKSLFAKAEKIADILGLRLRPFPPKAKTSAATLADVIHYLIKGDGAQVGAALTQKFDKEHGILFEISVKSNLLLLLYAPGDQTGSTIGNVIQTRSADIGLPQRLWSDLVTAIKTKQTQDQVKELVFKMHKEVAQFLLAT